MASAVVSIGWCQAFKYGLPQVNRSILKLSATEIAADLALMRGDEYLVTQVKHDKAVAS